MAPRRSARPAAGPKANGDVVTLTKLSGATRGRPRKASGASSEEPKVNGVKPRAVKQATGTTRSRANSAASQSSAAAESASAPPKKAPAKREKADDGAVAAAPAPAPAANTNAKRKKTDDSDGEHEPQPQQKKTRTRAATKADDTKPKPKGPWRRVGKKIEINPIRYTEPLKVFVFGEGSSGELGFGATKKAIDVKRPRYNEPLSNLNVVRLAAGGMHVVALTKDNKILTWGVNDNGALGRDTSHADVKMKDMDDADNSDSDSDDDPTGGLNDVEATPTAISDDHFPEDTVFVDVAAGDSCSFALTTEGAVYGWGTFRKNEGVLGFVKTINTARTPVYIDSLKKITQIACGTNHVLALDKDQHVWAWGNGQQNQLGRRVIERSLIESLVPNRVGFHDNSVKRPSQKMSQIACGDYHSFAIGSDGHVWGWGANNYAETGFPGNAGAIDAVVTAPQIIHSLEGRQVESLAAGAHHNMAVTAKGELLTWGRCDSHQTGIPLDQLNAVDDDTKVLKGETNGKAKILVEPTPVPGLENISMAACGPDHTIAVTKDGKAYSWGFSTNYQTGQGTYEDVVAPTRIENTAVKEEKILFAGCGGQYSLLVSLR